VRKFDNFYRRRPRTALAIMIAIAFIALYAADQLDEANSAAWHLQAWSATARSAT
jgi:hypothetical protein